MPNPDRAKASHVAQSVAIAAFHGLAVILGAAILVALLATGVLAGMTILFYRALALLAITLPILALVMALIARKTLAPRDAVSSAIVAGSILVAFFIVGPVTVDRSISVFMLSRFENAPGGVMSEKAARDAFVQTYIDDWRQIERRLQEQETSGNLRRGPEGWRLTPQGQSFMDKARLLSRLFAGDPRFVNR
jgi:ribosomal protein S19E (S16A)